MPFQPLYGTGVDVRRTKCVCSGLPVYRILSAGCLLMLGSTIHHGSVQKTRWYPRWCEREGVSGEEISARGVLPSKCLSFGGSYLNSPLGFFLCHGVVLIRSVFAVLRTRPIPTCGRTVHGPDSAEPVFSV